MIDPLLCTKKMGVALPACMALGQATAFKKIIKATGTLIFYSPSLAPMECCQIIYLFS
jgi:hypothetical protein